MKIQRSKHQTERKTQHEQHDHHDHAADHRRNAITTRQATSARSRENATIRTPNWSASRTRGPVEVVPSNWAFSPFTPSKTERIESESAGSMTAVGVSTGVGVAVTVSVTGGGGGATSVTVVSYGMIDYSPSSRVVDDSEG
ncbi:hypothetical protein ACWGLC_17565 [Dietzia sp. NPDC055877]